MINGGTGMPSNFISKQVNDVKQEDLAVALMALSSEGFTDWQILVQQGRTDFIFEKDYHEPMLQVGERDTVELYFVIAWRTEEESDEDETA